MANLPKRPCKGRPGCPALVEYGRCPVCQQQAALIQAVRVSRRQKTATRGYGKDHRALRVECFVRDQWKCVDCGWEPELVSLAREAGITVPTDAILEELRIAFHAHKRHLHADHEIPIEERPDLRLDLANLRTRCDVCHNAKTAREDGGFGNRKPQPETESRASAGA